MAGYDLQQRLGAGIRDIRERRNLTQEQVAERAHISTKNLGEIERGVGNACMDTIESICSALRVDLPLLLPPLATADPGEQVFSVPARHLRQLREAMDALGNLPSARDATYPMRQRRPTGRRRKREGR